MAPPRRWRATSRPSRDFSEKLQNGLKLTYRAEYTDTDGKKITVEQQPPNSVYINDTGPLIITADAIYACDNSSGTMTCTKTRS